MKRIRQTLATLGSFLSTVALSLIPVFKSCPPCPLCMPKYAAILSFLGLPLADYNAYLMPIMWISMAVTIGSLAWQGPRQYGDRQPALVATLGCTLILIGRLLECQFIVYFGMAGLLGAMLWHQRRQRQRKSNPSCCAHHHST